MQKQILLIRTILLVIIFSCAAIMPAIYVSPSGKDINTGTIDQPLYSISAAVAKVKAGDTILVRGGTYTYTTTIQLSQIGTDAARYYLLAYPGEHPVLDFSGMVDSDTNRGFFLGGSYWYIKGFEIYRPGDNGMKVEGNHNVIELCLFHHCRDTGLQIGLAKNSETNKGDSAAYNMVLNCDSHDNCDMPSGKNADGFACKLCPGPGNVFIGCRSWNNSDDGWDCYQAEYTIRVENCWTWHNGDAKLFPEATGWGGNGNGFKLGGNSTYGANNIAIKCISFDHSYGTSNCKGYDQNDNNKGITLLNCVAWLCKQNFALSNDLTGANFHTVKNCVGFMPATGGKNYSFCSNTNQTTNSWNVAGVVADSNDFKSISPILAMAPREADGSLPNNDFGKLANGSDLIDKGTNVGFPFAGSAPDLGAFETGLSVDVGSYLPQKKSFTLEQNYPNPFNPSTIIAYELPVNSPVTLKVYTILGTEVATLVDAVQPAGKYSVRFQSNGLPSGIYVYTVSARSIVASRKMLLVK